MPLLGAHLSIAGGYYKAVQAAAKLEMETVQVFTKNNNQWRAKPISDDDVAAFQNALAEHQIVHPLSHASYLINLASPDDALWQKSLNGFVVEMQRAEKLGIPYVVLHPGAYTHTNEQKGLQRVVDGLNEVHRQLPDIKARCLLENTAGQGTCLGCKFEQLAEIINNVDAPHRLGVCFDTCHAFAAGYEMDTPEHYEQTMGQLDRAVGLDAVKAVHLNDSKKPLGSRVDRHDHIGQGRMGLAPFRHLLSDPRFQDVPMYLETPKEKIGDEEGDAANLRVLRALLAGD